jgi:hypothetical protein
MSYRIKEHTLRQAQKLGVTVKPSKTKGKKIDVYKKEKKIASVGAIGYSDYPTYTETHGLAFAEKRRKLYKKRHEKDRHIIGTAGYYADKLLW